MEREDANRLLLEAGIWDALITRHSTWDCNTGNRVDVWLVGRLGPDEGSTVELGRGRTLQEAVDQWRGIKTYEQQWMRRGRR